ncbi:MAG: response regulator [Acidobacteria bacterium]|nr:response regulator [Acidobacteriota bacterium]
MSRLAPTLILLGMICLAASPGVARAGASPVAIDSHESPLRLASGWQEIRTADGESEPSAGDPRWSGVDPSDVLGATGSVSHAGVTWLRTSIVLSQVTAGTNIGVRVGPVEYGGVSVHVQGRLVGAFGPSGTGQPHVLPRPFTFDLPAELRSSPPTWIVLRVWRDPEYAGIPEALGSTERSSVEIGRSTELRLETEQALSAALLTRVDILALGIAFVLAGLYHIQLYWRRREQTGYLWFGAIAVFASLNMIFASVWGKAALQPLTAFFIARTAFHLAGAAWIGFIWTMFDWRIGLIPRAFMGLQIGLAALTVAAPSFVLITLADYPVFNLIAVLALWFVLIPYKAIRGSREARTICVGVVFLASARLWQTLGGLGFVPPANYAHWGFFALLVSSSISLSNRFSRVHEELDELNQRLEEKVAERTAELAQTVERLRESERLAIEARESAQVASESKSLFLASMSHELRTPLNAILGFVQLLRRRQPLNEETRHGLSVIMRSGEHLLSLINDILSITKIEAGQMSLKEEPFDLHGLVDHLEITFRPRAEVKGLELHVRRDDGVPRFVCGDDGKVRQILINLLGNAVRYTQAGRIELSVSKCDGETAFTVSDTGYGIAEEEFDRLFTAFSQTASGLSARVGTGLGLAISRANARLMGGDITVESRLDVGSRFVLTLHLREIEAFSLEPASRVDGLEPGHPDVRILVVDDVTENRHILSSLLADARFTVAEASTGRDAIAKWASWKPDLIWMDIRMAGLDGIDATRAIREREKESQRRCVIIALTASAFDTDRDVILDAGCDDFVPKPFLDSVIFAKIREHLGVRYSYTGETEESAGTGQARSGGYGIDVDALSALPAELLDGLERAVREGDAESAIEVSGLIEELDGRLSGEVRVLVRQYRFDEIADALEAVRRGTGV